MALGHGPQTDYSKGSVMNKYLVLLLALAATACASPAEKQTIIKQKVLDSRIDQQVLDQPEWFLNPPISDDTIYGVGTSSLSNQGAALQQAKLKGMAEIAQQISTVVDSMSTSTFTGQETNVGTVEQGVFQDAAKAIASAPLRGVVIAKRQSVRTETGLQTYVMVRILKDDAARSATQQIQKLNSEVMEADKKLLEDLDAAVRKRL